MLLAYYWGKKHLFVLAISPGSLSLARMEQDSVSNRHLSSFRERLKNRKRALAEGLESVYFSELLTEGEALFQWLLQPFVKNFTGVKNLIVIPDGMLNYLPFGTLLTETTDRAIKPNYVSLPYLLKLYPVNYRYSATLFMHNRTSDRDESEYPVLAVAPDYQSSSPFPIDIQALLSNSETRDGVSPLAYNSDEAAWVTNTWGGKSLIGPNASESAFKKTAQEARILHMAMHAFSDDDNPMHSGLVFNPSTDTKDEDGILYAHEIYNMNLKAEMVILSACNTGSGQFAEGEGVMSLARSFAYAGCPSTTMSLWQADDEAVSAIMQFYHSYLNAGKEKSIALQQAKLDFLKNSDRTHPYFWAAFLTIGDDESIDHHSFPFWAYLLIALILLAAGIFFSNTTHIY